MTIEHPFRPFVARLLDPDREGFSYVEDPTDRGGCCKGGITLAALEEARGVPCSCLDVRELSRDEALEIYWRKWACHPRLRLDLLRPLVVADIVLDTAVLFGRRRAALWLQDACNDDRLTPTLLLDGQLGERSRATVALGSPHQLVAGMVARRMLRHAEVVHDAPGQARFLVGWTRRAVGFL